MADVTRDRAQMFLVGALSLAVMFVALALVLNTAIYTENLATRSDKDPGSDAIEFRGEVEAGVGGLVTYANYHDNGSTYGPLVDGFRSSVENWSEGAARQAAIRSRLVNASASSVTNGTRIVQRDVRNFSDRSGQTNWTLATNVHVRGFRMNVSQSDLASATATSRAGAFNVTVTDDATDTWVVSVYRNGSGGTGVAVERPTGTVESCTRSSDDGWTSIDVTGATVNGSACDALSFLDDVSGDYDVSYESADRVEGRYELFVDDPLGDLTASHYHPSGSGNSPSNTSAVYAATVTATYESKAVSYRTSVRVVPENDRPLGGSAPAGGGGGGGGAADPTFDNVTVTDNSNGNHARFEVSYAVSDPDDNFDRVEITFRNLNDSSKTATDTSTALSDTRSYRSNHANGDTYDIVARLYDGEGLVETQTYSEETANGSEDGEWDS